MQFTPYTREQRIKEQGVYSAQPLTREELWHDWKSDPKRILEQADEAAKENGIMMDTFINHRSPPTPEHDGSAIEQLLYNEGILMESSSGYPATSMTMCPDIDPPRREDLEPAARLMNAYWDDKYHRAKMTGIRTRAASLTNLGIGSAWRPRYDTDPTRKPLIAPAVPFERLLADMQRIPEDVYRVNNWLNKSSEQVMQEIAEGTAPKLFELTRGDKEWRMSNYRAGIEATDQFLSNSQVRTRDITNAIEEIAIGHRIALTRQAAKLIHDSMPNGNKYTMPAAGVGGVTREANVLKFPFWIDFKTKFGSAYNGNVAIGNQKSITDLKLMSITDGTNLSFGSWSMVPGSNIEDLNADMTDLAYGWVDNVTELVDSSLIVFQLETTLVYVERIGMYQDEIERVAGPRKTRRWMGLESLLAIIDETGIRELDYATV